MRRKFNLQTPIGRLTFQVISADQIYVQTIDERSGTLVVSPVVIRGKEHTWNIHFTLLPNGTWEALTWSRDGNNLVPVDPTSEWSIIRAGYVRTVNGGFGKDATTAAHLKFYEVIKTALTFHCQLPQNWVEISDEMKARAVEKRDEMVTQAAAKVAKLRNDLAEATEDLARLLA